MALLYTHFEMLVFTLSFEERHIWKVFSKSMVKNNLEFNTREHRCFVTLRAHLCHTKT